MTAKKNLKEVEALKDVDYATSILSDAIQKLAENGDAQTFLLTLRKLTKAQGGMTALSKRIGINRQNLYRISCIINFFNNLITNKTQDDTPLSRNLLFRIQKVIERWASGP